MYVHVQKILIIIIIIIIAITMLFLTMGKTHDPRSDLFNFNFLINKT